MQQSSWVLHVSLRGGDSTRELQILPREFYRPLVSRGNDEGEIDFFVFAVLTSALHLLGFKTTPFPW